MATFLACLLIELRLLNKFTDRICQRQHLTLRKLSAERKEEIQFGRFIRNERVTMLGLEQLIYEQFRAACPASGHLLLIEDTSQLTFSLNRKISGLGKIDKGQVQGFYLHPVLCLNASSGACYGLAGSRRIVLLAGVCGTCTHPKTGTSSQLSSLF